MHGGRVRPAISLYLNPYRVSIKRVMDTCATFTGGKVQITPLFIAGVRSDRNGMLTAFSPRVRRIVDTSDTCGVLMVLHTMVGRNAKKHIHECKVATSVNNGAKAAGHGSSK